jgi:Peptidase family M1 domain/Peptidase M1 N-terminal domain
MSRKLPLVVVLALALVSLPGIALGAPPGAFPAGSAGIGDPYFPLDGNGGYDVQHYDLDVSYDPATDRLIGVATIEIVATQNLSAFNLDFVGMRLRSLTIDGVAAKTTRKGQELTVKPKAGITSGSEFIVVARYDGVPQTLEDFGTSGFIHTDDGAIVVGEPHVAETWFPVNNHPRDKASFTVAITVPAGVEAISNGVLLGQQDTADTSTWMWDAVEPMVPYLLTMAIGQFEVGAYEADGLAYWDAIDSALVTSPPPIPPVTGDQLLFSQVGEPSYKRLSRTMTVPAGGATMSFQANRDTEEGWDFLFVESRTAGGDDWTTLPDQNGHTSQDLGACPFFLFDNPFLTHYVTDTSDEGDPENPDDDVFSCDPVGTTGAWNAISGHSDGWESWSVALPAGSIEVSITYVSDCCVQGRGVGIDDIVVSTGQGTTSFEDDGNTLDGWTTPDAPEGSQPNPNTWISAAVIPPPLPLGDSVQVSFDRQPEIIDFLADNFGPYPFSAAGGIVDNVEVGFALENQTRPTYSPFFFGGPEGNDFVVVHEYAHQWYGDSVAVDTWQHIWLNEGFATYAEWLWSEEEGFETSEEIFDSLMGIPAEDEEFWGFAIGDPGPEGLFNFQVYVRGAMTLEALRQEVGDHDFFNILEGWATSQAGGTGTTREFIDLAESISKEELDPLFDAWLSSGKPEVDGPGPNRMPGLREMPAAAQSLIERLHDRQGNPFKEAKDK